MASELTTAATQLLASVPEKWRRARLDEVCAVIDCPHTTPALTEEGPYVVRSQDMRSGFVRLETTGHVSEETYLERTRRSMPEYGDILYSREGTYFGIAAEVPRGERICLGQRMVQLRPNKNHLLPRFLRYWLNSPLMGGFIAGLRDGSVAERLNMSTIRALPVALPRLSVQVQVSEVLGALDDRIELLRKTNATLESIAQAQFKSWFIDFDPVRAKAEGREPEGMDAATAALFPAEFEASALGLIPKGWRVGCFGGLAALAKGSVNPLDFPTLTFEHYSLPAFDASQLPVFEPGEAIKSHKTRVPRGAVLQSKLNPHIPRVWFVAASGEHAVCSTEFLPWVARDASSPELVYCTLRSAAFEAQVKTLVTGTSNSHQRVKPDQVGALSLIIASNDVQKAFADLARPMLAKVAANRLHARNLAEVRDSLLPRLISGKLRLPEAQEQLEEALA